MSAAAREGVIKFALDFTPGPPPLAAALGELNAWRQIFVQLGLLGQDPNRYEGLGFGNLSRRLAAGGSAFVISGTQTGGLARLQPEHYVIVQECHPDTNRVRAAGQIKPSSEALSHGIVYNHAPHLDWVMHLHSPTIFARHQQLGLAATDPAAAYGTPAMATEIRRLLDRLDLDEPQLIVMAGHEDGILACGQTADQVGSLVVRTLAEALRSAEG